MFFWGACLIEGGYAFLLASDCVIEIEQTFAPGCKQRSTRFPDNVRCPFVGSLMRLISLDVRFPCV